MRIFQHLPHEAVMGRTREHIGSVNLPPRPPEPKEVIESKLIPCERCGTVGKSVCFGIGMWYSLASSSS
jgi:hypothetical protein